MLKPYPIALGINSGSHVRDCQRLRNPSLQCSLSLDKHQVRDDTTHKRFYSSIRPHEMSTPGMAIQSFPSPLKG